MKYQKLHRALLLLGWWSEELGEKFGRISVPACWMGSVFCGTGQEWDRRQMTCKSMSN